MCWQARSADCQHISLSALTWVDETRDYLLVSLPEPLFQRSQGILPICPIDGFSLGLRGITPAFKKVDMFRDLQAHLRHLVLEKRVKVTVVLDEAQYLSPSILRDLKMLTNFDMDSRDCFACVLVGQSVLVQYLSRQPYEALRQRLVVNYQMEGPDEAQARDYVREMLRRAGGDPALFDDAALASAYGACGGSIRRLNSIVVNAMMIGSQLEARHIDAGVVLKAIEEASLR